MDESDWYRYFGRSTVHGTRYGRAYDCLDYNPQAEESCEETGAERTDPGGLGEDPPGDRAGKEKEEKMNDHVIGTVYETYDYKRFVKLEANRIVSPSRLNKIIESLTIHDISTEIICNEKWEIIDGQGRFEARKKMGLPIPYRQIPGLTIKDCQLMNTFTKTWDSEDYVTSHSEKGNDNFIRLLKIKKETGMPYSRILRYAGIGQHDKSNRSRIISEDLVFTEEHCRKVLYAKNIADEILEALCYTQRPNEAFFTAVKIMIDTAGYNHNTMLVKCRECRQSYAQMSKLEDQLKEFTRVYNHKKKGKKIYFEDYMRGKGYNVRNYDNNVNMHEDKSLNVSTLKKSAPAAATTKR